MENVNKQLLDAAKKVSEKLESKSFVRNDLRDDLRVAIAAAQQQAEPVARIKTVGGYPDDSRHELELLVKHGQLSDGQLLYAAQPPVVAVQDEIECDAAPWMSADTEPDIAYRDGWNACRDAMLVAAQKGGAA